MATSNSCEEVNRWTKDGFTSITTEEMSYEFFAAYTISKLNANGQGRTNINTGISLTKIGDFDLMPRIWFGVDTDVRKSLKLIGLLAYDEYLPTTLEDANDKELSDIHLDFGFIYAFNRNFRLGVHFTRPWLALYWKF